MQLVCAYLSRRNALLVSKQRTSLRLIQYLNFALLLLVQLVDRQIVCSDSVLELRLVVTGTGLHRHK